MSTLLIDERSAGLLGISGLTRSRRRYLRSGGTYRQGMSGHAVQEIQADLNGLGYNACPCEDGDYGPRLAGTVRQFQQDMGLTIDGAVGPETKATLAAAAGLGATDSAYLSDGVIYQLGSSGAAVTDLQTDLSTLGYPIAIDGQFGSETEGAVRQFQAEAGIVVDGVVGPQTKQQLAYALEGAGGGGTDPGTGGGDGGVTPTRQALYVAGGVAAIAGLALAARKAKS